MLQDSLLWPFDKRNKKDCFKLFETKKEAKLLIPFRVIVCVHHGLIK